jgi:hypothetical protein
MKSQLALSVGILALLGLLGVTVAEMQTAETEAVQDAPPAVADTTPSADQPVPEAAVDSSVLPAPAIEPPVLSPPPVEAILPSAGASVQPQARGGQLQPARGLYIHIRPDGTTVGRVKAIDRSTLLLKPVVGALVSFLQDRKIVAQGLSDEHGTFAVRGLTPWGVYSVTMSASDSVCMFAVVVLPPENDGDRAETSAEKGVGVTPGWVNEIRFASLAEDSDDGSNGHMELNDFQVIPREDFLAALQNGAFGSDTGGLPPTGMLPGGGTGMGGGGMGGGGGGGAGGGGGGGLGGALIGAGVAAGLGAALGGDDEDVQQASPFAP